MQVRRIAQYIHSEKLKTVQPINQFNGFKYESKKQMFELANKIETLLDGFHNDVIVVE